MLGGVFEKHAMMHISSVELLRRYQTFHVRGAFCMNHFRPVARNKNVGFLLWFADTYDTDIHLTDWVNRLHPVNKFVKAFFVLVNRIYPGRKVDTMDAKLPPLVLKR